MNPQLIAILLLAGGAGLAAWRWRSAVAKADSCAQTALNLAGRLVAEEAECDASHGRLDDVVADLRAEVARLEDELAKTTHDPAAARDRLRGLLSRAAGHAADWRPPVPAVPAAG